MKKRIQPPKELKFDLMVEVGELLMRQFPKPTPAVIFLLDFFSTFDLVSIRDTLKERERRNVIQSQTDRQRH